MKPIHIILGLTLPGFSVKSTKAQHFNQALQSELSTTNPGKLFSIKLGDGQLNWSGGAGINELL